MRNSSKNDHFQIKASCWHNAEREGGGNEEEARWGQEARRGEGGQCKEWAERKVGGKGWRR